VRLHNLQFMNDVTVFIRQAIQKNRFAEAKSEFFELYFSTEK
jgi:queuine/archaeosine tRNA-ribosyltransferase